MDVILLANKVISLYLQGTLIDFFLAQKQRRYIPVPTGNSLDSLSANYKEDGISLYLQGTHDLAYGAITKGRYIPVPTGNS